MDVLERVSDIGIAPSGLAPKARNNSKPVVQHNPDANPLNPLIVVNQTLTIAIVIMDIPLDRIPHRKAITQLNRRLVV